MKFWLIIFLIDPTIRTDENMFGKIEIAYPSKQACDRARIGKQYATEFHIRDNVFAVVDPHYKPVCVSDDHRQGRRVDPGVHLD